MGRLRSLILVAPALLAACDGDQGPRTPAGIVVTPNRPQVPMGGTRQLTVTVVDADGRAIDGEPVAFESAEPDVVTVGEDGLLTSVGSLDTVTITAGSGSHTAEVEAEVVPPPSALTVSPTSRSSSTRSTRCTADGSLASCCSAGTMRGRSPRPEGRST